MADTATLSSKFQISIPKAVRERHGWEAGQKFAFLPKDGGIMLVPAPTREQLRGIAKGADPSADRGPFLLAQVRDDAAQDHGVALGGGSVTFRPVAAFRSSMKG